MRSIYGDGTAVNYSIPVKPTYREGFMALDWAFYAGYSTAGLRDRTRAWSESAEGLGAVPRPGSLARCSFTVLEYPAVLADTAA
jgi:hypothetical protein